MCLKIYFKKLFWALKWSRGSFQINQITKQVLFRIFKKYTSLKVLWRNYKEEWLFPKNPINKQIPALFQTPFSSTDWAVSSIWTVKQSVILTKTNSSSGWQLMGLAHWLIVINGSSFITHCAVGPCVLSVVLDTKTAAESWVTVFTVERGKLLPPIGLRCSLRTLQGLWHDRWRVFWLQFSKK